MTSPLTTCCIPLMLYNVSQLPRHCLVSSGQLGQRLHVRWALWWSVRSIRCSFKSYYELDRCSALSSRRGHSPHSSCQPRDTLVSKHSSVLTRPAPLWLTPSPSCFLAGGMREIAVQTNRQYMRGLVGCVSHFTLSTDYHISLVEDAVDGKNVNTCGAK